MQTMKQMQAEIAANDKSGLAKLSGDALFKAFLARMALALGQAVVAAHWIGPWWSVAWLGAIVFNEFVFSVFVTKRHILPYVYTDPDRAGRNGGWLTLFCTLVHSTSWVACWIIGGESFSYVAALCFCGALIHAQTYFSSYRSMYAACIAPGIAFCLAFPFFMPHATVPSWVIAVSTLQILFAFFLAQKHADSLSTSGKTLMRKWTAAEDASRAKSQFLATMRHELRTPLNAVIGYAEILEETLHEDGRDGDAADAQRIHRAAHNLLELINEVLDLSKIEAGKMEVVLGAADIREIVADVVQTTAHLAEKNGNIVHAELALDRNVIVTDAAKVRQCLLNLVSNACKFTENGRIAIRARLENADLRFEVTDTGCGISEDDAKRLFQPFVQADSSTTRKHTGTGLGLVITQRMARLLGGDVSMISEQGKGSTFSLWFAAPTGDEESANERVELRRVA
jgi:signal transduction histidine kinase